MQTKINITLISISLLVLFSCEGGSRHTSTHIDFGGNMDWKVFRGDPSLSGFTNISLPQNPTLKWTYVSGNRTAGSPVVYQGVTYWADRRGRIFGIDINGNLVFDLNLETAVDAPPMIYNSTLYIGRIDGYMNAISLETKETLWAFETWGQISGSANIVEFEGRTAVVFGSYDNYLYCLDAKTGEELSRFASGNFINGTAAVWENYVLFGGCDAWLRVIDSQTGVAVDSLQLETYVPNSPAIMGNIGFVGDHSGNIYKLQFENGRIIHHEMVEHQDNDAGSNIAVPAVSPDAVYFYSGRHLYAVSRADGTLIWSQLLSGNTGESSPVVANDRVIACTRTGVVSTFDARTGELLWEYDTGEQILGSPAVVEGHFMVLTGRGTLLCFF